MTVTGNVQVQMNAVLNAFPVGTNPVVGPTIEGNVTVGAGATLDIEGAGGGLPGTARIDGNVTADSCNFVSLGNVSRRESSPNTIVGGNVLIQYCQPTEPDNIVTHTEIGGNFACNSNLGCAFNR